MLILNAMEICNNPNILKIIYVLKNALNLIFLFVPIVLVVLLTMDFIKNITSSNDDEIRKNVQNFIKRIAATIVLFLVPTITNLLFGIVDSTLGNTNIRINYLSCWQNATEGTISLRQEEWDSIMKEREQAHNEYVAELAKENESNNNSNQQIIVSENKKNSVAKFLEMAKDTAEYIVDHKWYYDDNTSRSWETAKKKNYLSCAEYVCYVMQQMGYLKSGQLFYGKAGDGGTIQVTGVGSLFSDKPKAIELKNQLKKNFYIIECHKTIKQLEKENNLKKGDIVMYYNGHQHTNIYAGRDSKGRRTWYDFGIWGTKGFNRYTRFEEVMITEGVGKGKRRDMDKFYVSYILRLKT